MGLIGVGDVSPARSAAGGVAETAGGAGGTGAAGGSCDLTGTARSGAPAAVPSFTRPERFLLRGSVVDFDPASSASINKELSCSNAIKTRKE